MLEPVDGEVVLRHHKVVPLLPVEHSLTPHNVWDRWIELYGRTLDAFYPVADTAIGRIGTMMANEASYPENARGLALNGCEIAYRGPYPAPGLALAVTPPGLFAKSAWLSPNAAARSYAELRRSSNANGSGPTISLGRASACGSSSCAVTDTTATTAAVIAPPTAATSTARRRRALDRVGLR